MIYLDHAATTPMLPEVWEAMRPYAFEHFGNPASAHGAGRKARQALEDAREKIAHLLQAGLVVFTSGATEANNLALFGQMASTPGHLLASPIEHPCIVEPLKKLAERGHHVEFLPVDRTGRVDPTELASRVRPGQTLAVVQLVNHEIGTIQPINELARAPVRAFHTDAAQAIGKIPVSFRELGVTSMSVSAHKFGGPKGIGALLLQSSARLSPQLFGGHQQQGRRPGTEPVALAVGMARALELSIQALAKTHELRLRIDQWIERLRQACPGLVVHSPEVRSPFIVNVSFPGHRADLLLMKLDLAGLACSTGSACSSGSLLPSPVLQAIGVPDDQLRSAMRFSFSHSTTDEELSRTADIIAKAISFGARQVGHESR